MDNVQNCNNCIHNNILCSRTVLDKYVVIWNHLQRNNSESPFIQQDKRH
jgi:hypothetical protein